LYLGFFLIPVIVLLRYSFTTSEQLKVEMVWSLDSYRIFFESPLYAPLLLHSLEVAAFVAALAVLFGYPVAWIIARSSERWRNLLLVLLIIPWWSSFIVRVFAWYTVFGRSGVINRSLDLLGIVTTPVEFFAFDLPAVIITELNLYLPLMVLPIYMALERLDWNLVLGARSLGAGRLYTFRRIVLPLSLPGVIAGIIFVFMPVAGTFIVPSLLGGTGGLMIGKVIATQFGAASNWSLGAALAMILLLALLAALALLIFARRRLSGEFH
jgi:spermidine/putrescine transport system permease protein